MLILPSRIRTPIGMLQEELLPSEKAFAFKMKMDAIKRQGARLDLENTSGQNVPRLSSEEIGESAGMTGRQVKRYIRLNYQSKR